MITLFSSKERTKFDWTKLLELPKLGLRIVDIWSVANGAESLIECKLK